MPFAIKKMIRMRNNIYTVFPNQLSDIIEQLLHFTGGPLLLENAGGKKRMNFLCIIPNFEI
jgi:hypothetical protein